MFTATFDPLAVYSNDWEIWCGRGNIVAHCTTSNATRLIEHHRLGRHAQLCLLLGSNHVGHDILDKRFGRQLLLILRRLQSSSFSG